MMTALTAASTSASAQTITGSEPPSSSVTRFSAGPAIPMMCRPVPVSPANAIRRVAGDPIVVPPRAVLAGERDPADVGMPDEHVADLRAAAGDDVQHAVRHARL